MTKKFRKSVCALLSMVMIMGVCSCNATDKKPANSGEDSKIVSDEAVGYTFGLNETFKSDEPVNYSMYFSDASWYPMVDTWKTEGVFQKIKEKTNVSLDVTSYDSGDYTNKITLEINSGNSAFIIPKVYDESPFVDGGAVVAVSDWVKYMPHYNDFVKKYEMENDLNTIIKSDGKYYRLPGMHESPSQEYTLLIRDDIFKDAGFDVSTLEKDWTWDKLYDVLVGVKKYMVEKDMCSESDYIWSDLWCGSETGQGNGGYLANIMGASYGVKSGWGIGNALRYDSKKDEWYFTSTTPEYKEFVTMLNKFVSGGILDPETFTQDDTTASNKFYNGQTVIIGVNKSQYVTWLSGLDTGIGAGKYSTYVCTYPKGNNNYTAENTRLENGVMISKNALTKLGEKDFIKMLRFVDWLWYSDEAYTLTKWGPEGETWKYEKDSESGTEIKKLLPGFKCGGLGVTGTDDDKDIRLEWGYAGGNFFYGHSVALRDDNLIPVFQNYSKRINEYREFRPLDPTVSMDPDLQEQFDIMKTSIIDTVNTYTLNFITGKKDIKDDWKNYEAALKNANVDSYVDMYNNAYKNTSK